jgi:hypothetical protein
VHRRSSRDDLEQVRQVIGIHGDAVIAARAAVGQHVGQFPPAAASRVHHGKYSPSAAALPCSRMSFSAMANASRSAARADGGSAAALTL